MKKQKENMKDCLETKYHKVTYIDLQNNTSSHLFETQAEAFDFARCRSEEQREEYATRFGRDSVSVLAYPFARIIRVFDGCSSTDVARYFIEEVPKTEDVRQGFKLIPDWQNSNIRCYFCGSTKSVKYEKKIFDPVLDDTKPSTVYVCNRCALLRSGKGK